MKNLKSISMGTIATIQRQSTHLANVWDLGLISSNANNNRINFKSYKKKVSLNNLTKGFHVTGESWNCFREGHIRQAWRRWQTVAGWSGARLTKEIQELEIQDQKKCKGHSLESSNMNNLGHSKLTAEGGEGTITKLDSCFYPDTEEMQGAMNSFNLELERPWTRKRDKRNEKAQGGTLKI